MNKKPKKMSKTDSGPIPHIVEVTSYFYPKIGGVENYVNVLAKKLHKSGEYRVSVITTNYEKRKYKKEIIDGVVIHRLPIWFKISNTPINPMWYFTVRRILKSDKPELVHTHSPVPGLADIAAKIAKDMNIPIVATYHSGGMRKGRWLIDVIISLYEKIFLHKLFIRADAIVAISQSFAQREFPQFNNKTFFIPTGVDLDRFSKTVVPIDTEVVTFVGRIEYSSSWKGIDQLLKAMTIVIKNRPKARLELVGGGDAVEYYRQMANSLGLNDCVKLVGPKYDQDLVDSYSKTNVLVLPSTSDSEAFSVSLVEAMASGRPVIGTNIGGTPQVISNGQDGLLVAPKDPKALAAAIERILSDVDFAQQLGDTGALKAQQFDWNLQVSKYKKLFIDVMNNNIRQ